MLDHYVVFRPRAGKEDELSAALEKFGSAIAGNMPCLVEFTWGPNVNQSGLDHGFTHGCFARLTTQASLKEEYWIHPAHQALLGVLDELCEDRFALDYAVDDVIRGT
ncbi:MAG: Dabb family protein [Pseudonocardia sp.]|jgi:hypothetical protein|uniref:Dabb family protein n=1 Tax=Pseudonocardia sp. TaxID=60912 RepID=UPI00261F8C75|nr:Dabb family protein [Pseudonocardia sp.]MCU1629935.1 Dabb family protein [Pseudonocardia sp.]MDT7697723.1 hypothetical protein [Pseudonocardiales bacterium]